MLAQHPLASGTISCRLNPPLTKTNVISKIIALVRVRLAIRDNRIEVDAQIHTIVHDIRLQTCNENTVREAFNVNFPTSKPKDPTCNYQNEAHQRTESIDQLGSLYLLESCVWCVHTTTRWSEEEKQYVPIYNAGNGRNTKSKKERVIKPLIIWGWFVFGYP